LTPEALPHRDIPPELLELLPRLRCPRCHGGLDARPAALVCDKCSTAWAVRDGIAHLARSGAVETWGLPAAAESSVPYQQRYQRTEQAAAYNRAYRREALKRWSTRRELGLLRRLLRGQGRCETILDLPSGGGRLSGVIAAFADRLIEADIALGQLQYARGAGRPRRPTVWMTASAFHLPLVDDAVDATVCCRLSHHLPTPAERERLLRELLRVSRRFVVLTFFDHRSLKNLLRRVRRPFDHKPPKLTMTRGQLAGLARESRAELVRCPPLSRLGSGHRYALLVKRSVAGAS